MFDFLKRKKEAEECDKKIMPDEKSIAFFRADRMVRKAAGLEGKLGSYTFTCPNCGTECTGEWTSIDKSGGIHGKTGCQRCGISLVV